MKPARTVVTRSPHRSVGLVAGTRLDGAHTEHESDLEKAFIVLSNVCVGMRGLEAQPYEMSWTDAQGVVRSYVPDFSVTFLDGTKCTVEVKPSKFLKKNEFRFDQASRQLAAIGQAFFVVTEKHLTAKRFEMAQLWRRYRRSDLPNDYVLLATRMVADNVSWEQARRSEVPLHVWYGLFGRGAIRLRTADLRPDTRLLNPQEFEEHDFQIHLERWLGCSPWRTTV